MRRLLLAGLGQDSRGELYVVNLGGQVYKLSQF
jgi:hypothetical protein